MIIIECGPPFQARFARFRSTIDGRKYVRWVWLWWALTWFAGDQKQFTDAVGSGRTAWIDQ